MSYYKLLGFENEPFSTSPDPDFLYLSQAHDGALTNTLIELRLHRGLSVILGDVGTGKTTLSRKLVRCLKERGDFVFHMVMDPYFENEEVFLQYMMKSFDVGTDRYRYAGDDAPRQPSLLEKKEALESFLYQKTIIENKTVVLIIDEAQKLSSATMEMLRVLLNYETNDNKLLQLVLLGQLELHSKILNIPNFFDRISFKYTLNPLGLKETRDMVHFRIRQAGYRGASHLFLDEAIELIHRVSKGYPRKTTMLCHRALKNIVMKKKWAVDENSVREIVDEDIRSGWLIPTLQ